MLAAEYEENAENTEDTGCGIYAVEVEGKTARVDVRTLTDAQLIVSLFDEEGKTMYGSGMTDVTKDDSFVELTLEIDSMPQFFYIKAFLLDKYTNLPLCKQFENNYYTQEMQEFFAKTTDDFDEEKVLNLDDSEQENFLVYNDDTIIIDNDDENTNIVTKADDDSKEYVIENIDENIAALQVGDIFSYDLGNGNLLIIKIASVIIDGTTATIQGDEIELEEVFDYIKIDASQGMTADDVDNSDISDYLEYVGTDEESSNDEALASTGASLEDTADTGYKFIDYSNTAGASLKYKFKNFDTGGDDGEDENKDKSGVSGKFKATGSIELKDVVTVSAYWDQSFMESDIKFSLVLKFDLSITGSFELSGQAKLKLGKAIIPLIPAVIDVTFTPYFVIEGKITGEISGKLSGQLGFSLTDGQWANESKAPTFFAEVKVEAEIFIGLELEPAVEVLVDAIKAKETEKIGIKLKGKLGQTVEEGVDSRHTCFACIDGTVSFVHEASATVNLFGSKKWEFKKIFTKKELKLFRFYFSIDKKEFGIGECPHKSYRQAITLLDANDQPVTGATINGKAVDGKGQLVVFISAGTHTLSIEKDGKTIDVDVTIEGAGQLPIKVDFSNGTVAVVGGSSNHFGSGTVVDTNTGLGVIQSGKCGDNAFFTLYENGLLEVTGTNMKNWSMPSSSNPAPWYDNRCLIKSVNISKTVTNIGSYAFFGCESLSSITIGNLVTSIGDNSFANCINLTSIEVPDSVTDIGKWAFYHCTNLSNIFMSDSVYSIGSDAFSGTKWYSNQPNGLIYIGKVAYRMKGDCPSEVIIKEGTLGIAGGSFSNPLVSNKTLKHVILPDSVISIGTGGFYNCVSLTTIRMSDSVKYIGKSAFYGCKSLTNIIIPDTVINIGNEAFSGCELLSNVVIGNSVTSIGERAFYECKALSNLSIGSSVLTIGKEAFYCCLELTEIIIPDSVISVGDQAFTSCQLVTTLYIGNSVVSLGKGAFDACRKLKCITLPKSISNIGEYAFDRCPALTDVYYGGSIKDWQNINKPSNYWLDQANIHYDSSGPVTTGQANTSIVSTAASNDNVNSVPDNYHDFDIAPISADLMLVDTGETNGLSRAHLVPGTEAVLVILEGMEDNVEFNATSLLYIEQQTVSEDGTVIFDCPAYLDNKTYVAYIFGECDHSASTWTTSKEPSVGEEGLKVLTCDHCGVVLDSEAIEALPAEYLLGDADGNGEIESVDATFIQRYIAQIPTPYTKAELMRGDVDGSGDLELTDVTAIQYYLCHLKVSYQIGTVIP